MKAYPTLPLALLSLLCLLSTSNRSISYAESAVLQPDAVAATATPVFIDTDVGYDDIMAIMALMQVPSFQIVGISTVFGNADTVNATDNLLRLLDVVQRTDIPVYEGAVEPPPGGHLFPASFRAETDALARLQLPKQFTGKPQPVSVADAMMAAASRYPGQLILLCIGPQSNLNATIGKYGSAFVHNVARVVVMGGAVFQPGNVPPLLVSEWNFWADAGAAATLLYTFGEKVTLAPIDVADHVPCTPSIQAAICQNFTWPTTRQITFCRCVAAVCSWKDPLFYDPLSALYLIQPALFQGSAVNITVVTDEPQYGRTVPNSNPAAAATSSSYHTNVLINADADGVAKLMHSIISS